jgi:hypothetical protein
MPENTDLNSGDIPQSDSLASVRVILEAILAGSENSSDIVKKTEISDRHVRYRLQTARILGLIKFGVDLTETGKRLLQSEANSKDEKKIWRKSIGNSKVVRQIIPTLFQEKIFNKDEVARKLCRIAKLSPATAERRARVLRSWKNQLMIEEKLADGEG